MRAPLTPVELAAGVAFGRDAHRADELARLQRTAARVAPRAALMGSIERAVDPEQDVFVMFSGGLDSSLVLSATAAVRRAQGRPDPIPVTTRYASPGADESSYQEAVVRFLGLVDWIVVDVADDLDLLCPTAKHDLVTNGPSAAARVSTGGWLYGQLDRAGTMLTGQGGDEVFGPGPLAPIFGAMAAVRHRRHVVPSLRHAARRSKRLLAPARTGTGGSLPVWLTPAGLALVREGIDDTYGGSARTVRAAHRLQLSMRSNAMILADVSSQAAAFGFTYREPLLDLQFMAELVSTVGDRHFIGRNAFFRRFFPDLLPPEVTNRTSKASFNGAVFGRHTHKFATNFTDFDVLPVELVEPTAVRDAWLSGDDARSGLMLQHAWLSTR